ncbi:hypothetical protein D3H64_10100 [Atopobacter sp. AH10]|uniref:AAA family ATPase n=1 Tax=Atopobacter sp. AH10 TaxID=2315861 RepID=UPI000EF2391B|nr:AAA family ATPase [Atopobacter sp. AH10]RLK62392.1 hypothetical protein D3H64_10100 [Atopobacter sp. AH10]
MISRIILQNFRLFKKADIQCNDKMNIFVGENGAGKSTLLYAIGLVLKGSHSQIENLGLASLFNSEVVSEFLIKKEIKNLPEVIVELYLDESNKEISSNFYIEGNHNSQNIKTFGISLKITPIKEMIDDIRQVLTTSNWSVFPFEYYKVQFLTFAGKSYTSYTRPFKFFYSIVNTSYIDTNNEIQKRINEVYLDKVSEENRAKVNHQYRLSTDDLLKELKKSSLIEDNQSDFSLHFDDSENAFRNSISIVKNGIDIRNFGQGEKVILAVENAYKNLKDKVKILIIEEPENHLSFQNLGGF